MNNKIFSIVLGVIFITFAVLLCANALTHIALNPFAAVVSAGFAAIFGVAGVDLIKKGRVL